MVSIKRRWLEVKEDHFLISAAAEAQKAKQALVNQQHYQKQASLARSDRNSL